MNVKKCWDSCERKYYLFSYYLFIVHPENFNNKKDLKILVVVVVVYSPLEGKRFNAWSTSDNTSFLDISITGDKPTEYSLFPNSSRQCCGSKYIEFGSGSRILAQFGSGSGYRVILSILKEKNQNNFR